jgi:hypothetical protein
MSEVETVPIPEGAREPLRLMLAQRQQIEQQIQLYLKGIHDSLGLEGDDWTVEVSAMAFVKRPQPSNGHVDADVVGAMTE